MTPATWIAIGTIGITLILIFSTLLNIGTEIIETRRETRKALREMNKTLDAILKDAKRSKKTI